jgi:hypothetical protein
MLWFVSIAQNRLVIIFSDFFEIGSQPQKSTLISILFFLILENRVILREVV